MRLLTEELREEFTRVGDTSEKKAKDVKVVCKFFDPTGSWTWYATEGREEGNDFIFFGFVRGFENELGYFTLSELTSVELPFGLGIERDLHFGKHTLAEVMEKRI